MNNKTRLLLLAALFVLALPLIFTGTASAAYMGDGAVQHATNGGWVTPNDMMCIVGVHADGTVDVADGVTNARDCIYIQTGTMNGGTAFDLTGMTTSAACTTAGGTGNDGAKHSWATSFCTKSLKGLDRTQQMCNAIGGSWITTGKCVAYGRQFKGQDANGAPLAIGTKGTDAATAGYCYASMDMTAAYPVASCPSLGATVVPFNANAAYDWSVSGAQCRYAKGIAGKLASALTKADGTTVAAGTYIDLSTKTNMGDCLAIGGSWNNWVGTAATTSTVGTDSNTYKLPNWDYTKVAPDADTGCLHCHSSLTEYNGPAEREKDSYLKTGHKNMLRKVTNGKPWAGPDGVVYTTDGLTATGINFNDVGQYASVMVSGVKQNLYYIYGDWMAALPTLVYGTNGYGAVIGSNNGYGCGACHTAGYSDSSLTCTVGPLINTTAALCTAAGGTLTAPAAPGVQSIGTVGYKGVEPQNSFTGIAFANNPQWNNDGITCGRCHNAAVGPLTAAQIAATPYTSTQALGGGMGALTATNTGRTSLCFGCHQSIAKIMPANTTPTTDPTVIPTGVSHGAAVGRDFNGHVLGNSFLNSVHARYTGTTVPNALGKFDLMGLNGSGGTYSSIFKGYTCWQSPSSSSPAKTQGDGSEIKDKATCETLYGAGSWRADNGGNTTDPLYKQGTCATCHDVHNSMFVASQAEAAIRKTCEDCHVNNATTGATDPGAPQVNMAVMNHPSGAGTPFDTGLYESGCVVCHMASQAEANGDQTSMPVHVWRINTDPNYNTFPTMAQFYGGSCSVHAGTVTQGTTTYPIAGTSFIPAIYNSDISSALCVSNGGTWTATAQTRNATVAADGTYANAVWVDLDLACGQCHGGSGGVGALHNSAPYMSKAVLAAAAQTMHGGTVTNNYIIATFVAQQDPTTSLQINFDASSSTCPSGATCTYSWNFGDGSAAGTGVMPSHIYAASGTYPATLTVSATGYISNTASQTVTAVAQNGLPTATGLAGVLQSGMTFSFTDASTDPATNTPTGITAVQVIWGDGAIDNGVKNGSFSHTYTSLGNFTIRHSAGDAAGKWKTETKGITLTAATSANVITVNLAHVTYPAPVSLYLQKQLNGSWITQQQQLNFAGTTTTFNVSSISGYRVAAYESGKPIYYQTVTFSGTTATVAIP